MGIAEAGIFLAVLSGTFSKFSQANVDEFGATVAEFEGQHAQQVAEVEAQAFEEDIARIEGEALAIAGGTGLSTNTGSAALALDDIRRAGEIDKALILQRGDIGEWRADIEAGNLRSQAKQRRTAAVFSAGKTLLQSEPGQGALKKFESFLKKRDN